jgi:hypothetical protein
VLQPYLASTRPVSPETRDIPGMALSAGTVLQSYPGGDPVSYLSPSCPTGTRPSNYGENRVTDRTDNSSVPCSISSRTKKSNDPMAKKVNYFGSVPPHIHFE